MSWIERLVLLLFGLLIVAALVLLMRQDIGRNAAHTAPASADGGFWVAPRLDRSP